MRVQPCTCASTAQNQGASALSGTALSSPLCPLCLSRGFTFIADGQPEADIPGLTITAAIVGFAGAEQAPVLTMDLRCALSFRPAQGREAFVNSMLNGVLHAWEAIGKAHIVSRGSTDLVPEFITELLSRASVELRYVFISLVAQGHIGCSKPNPIVTRRAA